ncbi:alpha beta-hydrolase [Pyrrhoderma noxium]|uniref:Alpha beta-hydrolase n=1 Tax=Pyrrhoderma noxium TaxID=2282107 RepID=A0A286USG1_9AGAM|nr:alpha beta-hydrolase [Pyrrhoderma noxium]
MKDTIIEILDYPKPTPLILVEGFLSTTGSVGWSPLKRYLSGYEKSLGDRDVMIASVGPISSLHDRACELYYAIKGGTVDYGEDHSRIHGHKRYGRIHDPGLYPTWSSTRPLHFLGHSIGGATIMKLQYLLSMNFFSPDDHPDMMLSVTGVSSPFRGTQIVYTLGERTDGAPSVRPFSIGNAISKVVHILSYFSPVLPSALDFHADSRALSYRESSFSELLCHLWKSNWAESRDATPFDVTFEAADLRDVEGEGRCNTRTYYRSYTSCMTTRSSSSPYDPRHWPSNSSVLFPPLYLSAHSIGTFDFSALIPQPSFVSLPSPLEFSTPTKNTKEEELCTSSSPSPPSPNSANRLPPIKACDDDEVDIDTCAHASKHVPVLREEHFANDGIVPVFSQWHPLDCAQTQCIHHNHIYNDNINSGDKEDNDDSSNYNDITHSSDSSPKDPTIQPGIWNVYTLEDHHHLSLLPFWIGSPSQLKFWDDLGTYLDDIDSQEQKSQSYV